ncbi:MAG: hypothetical protein WA709_31575 [Stellaceae bacterium]
MPTGTLVSSEAAKRALGANVDRYVIPMFNSQTAIAYNTRRSARMAPLIAVFEPRIRTSPGFAT